MTILTFECLHQKMRSFGVTSDQSTLSELDNYTAIKVYNTGRIESIYEWCEINLGDNWIWSRPVHLDYVTIWFKSSHDAVMFKLKFNTLDI